MASSRATPNLGLNWDAPQNHTAFDHSCELMVRATDVYTGNQVEAIDSVTVTVEAGVHAIVVTEPAHATPDPVAAREAVELSIGAYDNRGHALQYSWELVSCTLRGELVRMRMGVIYEGVDPDAEWVAPMHRDTELVHHFN